MPYKAKKINRDLHQTKKCHVAIFADTHIEHIAPEVINNLLPFFSSKGFKVICFETHYSEERELSGMTHHVQDLLSYAPPHYKKNNLFEICRLIPKKAFNPSYAPFITSPEECVSYIKTFLARIKIFKNLEDNDMEFCGMDLSRDEIMPQVIQEVLEYELCKGNSCENAAQKKMRSKYMDIRDSHMVSKIKDACKEGHVLVLVGLAHYKGIYEKLFQDNFSVDVRGYYMPAHDDNGTMSYEKQIKSGRSTNPHTYEADNIVIIDMYGSNINATDIVLRDYKEFLSGNGQDYHDEL